MQQVLMGRAGDGVREHGRRADYGCGPSGIRTGWNESGFVHTDWGLELLSDRVVYLRLESWESRVPV